MSTNTIDDRAKPKLIKRYAQKILNTGCLHELVLKGGGRLLKGGIFSEVYGIYIMNLLITTTSS